jgi:hypothetical protein
MSCDNGNLPIDHHNQSVGSGITHALLLILIVLVIILLVSLLVMHRERVADNLKPLIGMCQLDCRHGSFFENIFF